MVVRVRAEGVFKFTQMVVLFHADSADQADLFDFWFASDFALDSRIVGGKDAALPRPHPNGNNTLVTSALCVRGMPRPYRRVVSKSHAKPPAGDIYRHLIQQIRLICGICANQKAICANPKTPICGNPKTPSAGTHTHPACGKRLENTAKR